MICDKKIFDILIVDDNLNNLNVLSGMLSQQNFKIRKAINGSLALRSVYALHPDLILLDIRLPDIDGYEICKTLKDNHETKDIPVIFVSALNESFDKVYAFDVGGVDYINKPFEMKEVLARIQNQLRIQSAKHEIVALNASLEEKVNFRTAQLESAKDEIFKLLAQERENHELKSNFVTMVSHEFRTPLASILSSTELLEHYYDKLCAKEKYNIFLQIHDAIHRMSGLLDNVLTLSKVDRDKLLAGMTEINIVDLCKKITHELIQKLNNNRIINFICDPESIIVNLDESILYIILKNILENAIKYSPMESEIVFEVLQTDQNLIFKISDEGIGIDSQFGDRLFEAFERGNNVGNIPGTGLGLSIVKRLTTLLSGEISFESELNRGTTFTIVFNSVKFNT